MFIGLEFADDPFFDQHVGEIFSNDLPKVTDGQRSLLPESDALGRQLDGHGILIDLLKETRFQRIVHPKSATNDPLRQFLIRQCHAHTPEKSTTGPKPRG